MSGFRRRIVWRAPWAGILKLNWSRPDEPNAGLRRLRESVIKVCEMGKKHDWFWHERYHAAEGNTVKPVGAYRYCKYPTVLVRVVLTNPDVFPEAKSLRG